MLTASTSPENSNLSAVTTAATSDFATKATSDRRREFEEMLPHVLPRFRSMATSWLGNPEDAEDAVQDAMLSAFQHIASFNGRAKMSSWLTAIVINAVRMQMRRRRRGRITLSLDYSPREGQRPISELLPDPCRTPEKALERFELRVLANKLTRDLTPSQRAALWFRYQADFSIREAAKKLGLPEGTLKAHLARGRAKLSERFHEAMARPKLEMSVSKARRVGYPNILSVQLAR